MKLINIQVVFSINVSPEIKRNYNIAAGYVATIFNSKIGVIDIPFTKKLVIELLDENNEVLRSDYMLILGFKDSPVSTLKRLFSLKKFEESTLDNQLLFLSEIIEDSLNYLLSYHEMPLLNNVQLSVNEFLAKRIIPLTKAIENKKNINSQLLLEFNVPLSTISLSVYDNNTNTEKHLEICKVEYLPFIIDKVFFKIKWLTNEIVQLSNKSGEFLININTITFDIFVNINPKDRTNEDVLAEMKFLIGIERLGNINFI